MKIVCAPDSFKESMSAAEAAAALAEGVRRVAPDAECVEIPMADGGEGFTESLADALGLSAVEAPVLDAYGRPALARFALADGLAVMECAQAIGLPESWRFSPNSLPAVVYAFINRGCQL